MDLCQQSNVSAFFFFSYLIEKTFLIQTENSCNIYVLRNNIGTTLDVFNLKERRHGKCSHQVHRFLIVILLFLFFSLKFIFLRSEVSRCLTHRALLSITCRNVTQSPTQSSRVRDIPGRACSPQPLLHHTEWAALHLPESWWHLSDKTCKYRKSSPLSQGHLVWI